MKGEHLELIAYNGRFDTSGDIEWICKFATALNNETCNCIFIWQATLHTDIAMYLYSNCD